MRRLFLIGIFLALNAHAQLYEKTPQTSPSDSIESVKQDTIYKVVYVSETDGIPWNRESFDEKKLLRHDTFDPALSVGYTYSVSFIHGPLGSLSQTSYLAHLAYEFSPELHLYADMGLWMPLYVNFNAPNGFAREDMRQGNVQFVLPDIGLEYKPSDNTSVRLMLVNERDAFRTFGPWCAPYSLCSPYRNSKFRY